MAGDRVTDTAGGATPVRTVVALAAATLRSAGVATARVDAELLAAHALDVDRGRLITADPMNVEQRQRFDEAVARRVNREPLQHIVGTAAFGPVELAVGPGVFTPRPETEVLLEWAVDDLRGSDRPSVVVDLCSGSGALAIAVATMVDDAAVIAVENDPAAAVWLRRNVSATARSVADRISIRDADVCEIATLRDIEADLVVANPPYIPLDAHLAPEVVDHDPAVALFGGADGMSVITPMIEVIAAILVPGGRCAIEHDDTTAGQVVDALAVAGAFDDIVAHTDLAGRPRFVTARRV